MIGTPGCFSSSGPCGERLNRSKGSKPVSFTPNRSIPLARRPYPAQAEMQRERPARDSEESSMQSVFVIDQAKQPLMPCHAARARKLLKCGKAAVYVRYPFTIILKERFGGEVEPAAIKVDPGSKQTGIAVVVEREQPRVVFAAEVEHRKEAVHNNLLGRSRKTRYRQPRFTNR